MTVYVPMLVSVGVWLALWLYLLRLDRKIRNLEKSD